MEVLSKNKEAAKSMSNTIAERDREMRRRMRALELRLPSFKPPSFSRANQQEDSPEDQEESSKAPVLDNTLPRGNIESDKNLTKRRSPCCGCRFFLPPSFSSLAFIAWSVTKLSHIMLQT
jgi:hypothetical protein